LEANLEAKMKEIKLNKIMKEKQASLPKTQWTVLQNVFLALNMVNM
jgi:hypothetical protein